MGFFFFLMVQSDFMVNFVMEFGQNGHIPSQNSVSSFFARQFDILKILVPEMLKNYYSTPRQSYTYSTLSPKTSKKT